MRHLSTRSIFNPHLKTSFLETAIAKIQSSAQASAPYCDEDTLAYQFLIHPKKKTVFAGEKVNAQAADLQIPLFLHQQDTATLIQALIQEEDKKLVGPVIMQGRLMALDGVSWIDCELRAYCLPTLYQELYGWHVHAFIKKTSPLLESQTEALGEEVLSILSQVYNAGIWRYDPKQESLEIDSALQRILKLEKRKFPVQEWLQHIHPEDVACLLKKVFRAQRKGGMFQLNIRYKASLSSHYRYLTLSAGAFSKQDAKVNITGLCFDGTQQQRLRSKNQLNKTFLDQAQSLGNIGCFEWLPDMNSLVVTDQLKTLSGLAEEEDFSIEFLQNRLLEEDFVRLQQVYQAFLQGEHTQEFTVRFRNASGLYRNLWIRAKASFDKSNMVSLIGIVQDITERIDQQEQLQLKDRLIGGFLKNLPVTIITINKNLQIISVIGAGVKQAGLQRKELVGQQLHDLLPEFIAPIKEVFKGTPTSFVVERPAEGKSVISLFNYYYYNAEREIAIGFSLDISQQKQAERAVQHMSQLEHRYALMDTFVHAVAHDLRSPVVNLDMLLSFFTQEAAPEEQSKYIAAMSNGIQHLKRTLDALIEILRIEKDSSVVAEEIGFEQLLEELEQEWGDKLRQAGGSLHTYLQAKSINYNRAYLSSILRNLISNAIKYSQHDRPPQLSICTEQKGNLVLLLVQDNGMGMDLSKWGHLLFQPFKRLNNKRNGTGIGLHLVKQIIEKNGGKIKVKSQPGEGSTFFCFLRPYN